MIQHCVQKPHSSFFFSYTEMWVLLSYFIPKLSFHVHLQPGMKQSCLVNMNLWTFSLAFTPHSLRDHQWKHNQVLPSRRDAVSEFIKLNELVGGPHQMKYLWCSLSSGVTLQWCLQTVCSVSLRKRAPRGCQGSTLQMETGEGMPKQRQRRLLTH